MTELEIVFESIKIGAIILGGLVALYEYRRFRRFGYKAQLNLDFDIYPVNGKKDEYLLDIQPEIENKASVRQKFPIIQIKASSLDDNDINNLKNEEDFLRFSKDLAVIKNIVPKPKDPYFIDPHVIQLFPRQVIVKDPGTFILVTVRFFYRVSFLASLFLRLMLFIKSRKNKNDDKIKKRLKRLKENRVYNYHTISKLKSLEVNR